MIWSNYRSRQRLRLTNLSPPPLTGESSAELTW
jgi:hypothetical protein